MVMCALLLLLVVFVTCGPTLPLPYNYSQEYSYEYDEQLPSYPLIAAETFEALVKTNRPIYASDDLELQPYKFRERAPKMRTISHSSRESQRWEKNRKEAIRAWFRSPTSNERSRHDEWHMEPFDDPPGSNEQTAWIWDSSDIGDTRSGRSEDDLDDRNAFSVSNCPTKHVKINRNCVRSRN